MTIGNRLEIAAACILVGTIAGFFIGLSVAGTRRSSPVVISDLRSPPVQYQYPRNAGFCDGDEDFCVATVTSVPAETLKRLMEALPDNSNGNTHTIRLSVISTKPEFLLPSPPTSIPLKEPPS